LVIRSSRESRSRVAPWSGQQQKVSTSANEKWRFTAGIKAGDTPNREIDNIRDSTTVEDYGVSP
jgi:hypothetical protein